MLAGWVSLSLQLLAGGGQLMWPWLPYTVKQKLCQLMLQVCIFNRQTSCCHCVRGILLGGLHDVVSDDNTDDKVLHVPSSCDVQQV